MAVAGLRVALPRLATRYAVLPPPLRRGISMSGVGGVGNGGAPAAGGASTALTADPALQGSEVLLATSESASSCTCTCPSDVMKTQQGELDE